MKLLLPCCKRASLTGCFCLRLLWREDHVLISICCTSTIHLHAHSQGKHSTHCANRSDPCRKAPAFSVRSDGGYTAAYTLRRSWTWLICKVGTRTRLKTHGTFEIPLSRRHPVLSIPFWSFIVLKEANKFVYHWKLQKEKEMTRHQVPNLRKKGSSDKRCLGSMPGHKMSSAIGINLVRLKSWACLFLISIPRFSVTLFPYQFVGQLRFLLPVPCLPGSQWNWHILRNNQSA